MDIPASGAALALSSTGATSASGSPVIANLPAQSTNKEQIAQGTQASEPAPVDRQTAFNDALLTIINGLLQGQGKEGKPLVVAGVAEDKSDDKQDEDTSATPSDLSAAPQQILDALLLASQQPMKPVTMNNTPSQSGEALLMNHRSGGGVAPFAAAAQPQSAMPAPVAVNEPAAQPLPALTRGMQSVMPQPLVTTLNEGVAALPTVASGQHATVSNTDKAASFQTQLATVKLEGGDDRLAQQLHAALGERLQVQVKNQIQHATIRLDPPDMGKIDISVQIENGRMQVHINASQGEVYRALQQVSNDLRQSLTEQNFVQVNVQVSSQSGQQGGKEQQFADSHAAVLAAAEPESDPQQTDRREDDSVLLTV
ncbi:flagellar hook-length control protein FliK [Enterobacteriaceae bacterium H20N1]|uniref:Flagellar hook-length control protein FliK n=1 Tax=Dryocola boscaweniae TaxID=2925397 RepID=A0A9X2W4Z4_9ENTR|nr:flagellar hook-length control protein FliK [Dryocola boscaweniae]MCT4700667.1 flagellar hook-length control protein FliK [Dryocola boscaweniae]MCT4716187.1 flagellar hook-length control protein FliK [Dryocola boscaweniae]MCT4717919.1 flagellar hook-length control protein FliK [Dryocola boscaweniae]